MKARALPFLLATLSMIAPSALADDAAGNELEASAPVTLEGRADTWLPGGTAGFLGTGGATTPVIAVLEASTADVVYRVETPCSASELPTIPAAPSTTGCTGGYLEDDETLTLRSATITVVKALSAYKVLATTDRVHLDGDAANEVGRILVTTATTATLSSNEDDLVLSGAHDAWTAGETEVPFQPLYDVPALSSQLDAGAALMRVTGGFETFLQGVQVKVKGIDENGDTVERTYDTRISEGEAISMLIVEAVGGDLTASASAPFTGFAPADERPITDVHNRATLDDARGTFVGENGEKVYDGESASLTGPVSLRLVGITDASPPRLTYAVTPGLQLADVIDEPTDEPMDPTLLAAAGAGGAAGAGALIALLYFWPRLKYALTLAFLPMYTRIERDAVLEHEKRDELYELIRSAPGIHAHEIGEKANIGWGTTVYHLKLLENHGLIVSKKSGRYKRFFVNTGEYTKKKDIYGALRNETAKAVADFIVTHPGTTQKEMCAALGIQPSLASWHVEKLEGVELVKRVKDGRMVRYFAGPAWQQLGTPVPPAPPAADVEGGAAS